MNSITEESGKQSPKNLVFHRSRVNRSVGSPSTQRHGRKSRHENDLKREEQLQAYTAWVNSQLKKRPGSRFIQDLPRDMKDGVALIQLIEVVAGEKLSVNENPVTLSSMRENVERVLNFMAVNKIRMHHTSAKEILEGNLKATMRLILALAAHFKPGSVKQSAQYQTGAVQTSTGKKIARTPSAAAAASEAAAAIAEASRAAASVGRHINSRYRRHKDVLSTPPRESPRSPVVVSEGTPMLPSAESSLLSTPKTGSQSSRSGRSTPGSGAATPKGNVFYDGSEHSGSDVDSGLMCSQNKSKETRLAGLTADFLNELSGEHDAMHDEIGETKQMLLGLQKILLDGRIEEDEVPEEYSFLEGTDLKDQLAIVNARLSQLSAEYDILKTERNNFKEDCVSLQGAKSGLTSRLSQQEEAIMQLKSELLKSSFLQQSRDAQVRELERKIDERDAEISALRAELLRHERTIDKQRAELEDTLRDVEDMRYAEASSSRYYSPDDSKIFELRQRIATLQEKLRNVASHEADISSRINNQDHKMKSLEEKILSPQSFTQAGVLNGPPRTEELELVRETIKNLRDSFHSNDPQQHTLDALEQTFTSLIMRQTGSGIEKQMNGVEYSDAFGYVKPVHRNFHAHNSRSFEKDSSGASTKILYFTENTVTPFLTTIPKRLGNITLRDFKKLFDHPGPYRFHFKALDPEFGTVKEEVINDDDVVPGWEGKIVAWVEEDRGLIALNHHDNTNYDVNMNEN